MTKYIYPIRSAKELVENIAKKAADKRKPKVNQHINEEEGDEFMDMGFYLEYHSPLEYLGLNDCFSAIAG